MENNWIFKVNNNCSRTLLPVDKIMYTVPFAKG